QAILDKSNGNNASASEVMAAKQAIDNAKKALNGKPNASEHEGNEDAMTKGTMSTPVTEPSVLATSQQSGSQTASKQLPQTGDDTSQALVTFGLGGTLLGLLGIASRKRKKLN
ncbi:LPXTG cell wall anchor domain-containing protein, partial [Limosilactobacillus ingluviei]|uniref:LPXTG cell wall anchor domain-containing protein n=1 Tax=Limosilactobacillus ingluviei TaxID=148604 RepID=UPI00058B3B3D